MLVVLQTCFVERYFEDVRINFCDVGIRKHVCEFVRVCMTEATFRWQTAFVAADSFILILILVVAGV